MHEQQKSRCLIAPDTSPTWSPNGSEMAFIRRTEGARPSDVYALDFAKLDRLRDAALGWLEPNRRELWVPTKPWEERGRRRS